MPKMSLQTGQTMDYGPVKDTSAELDDWSVSITSFNQHIDGAPMLRGLPNDNCACPHWGYVLQGECTFHFSDHDEMFVAGDAFYVGPGHTPEHEAGNRIVIFSPTEQLRPTKEALTRGTQPTRP
jgi:hypothetical protein